MDRPSSAAEERRLRVLVIDDEAPLRLLCRVNLEADGIEVLEADGGARGLELARAERPDAILLDLLMPRPDGWDVAAELVADERTRSIPIVFLTARVELLDCARGLEIDGVSIVTKPFDALGLAGLVRDLVARFEREERDERRGEKLAELRARLEAG